ncbi:LysR family transcriptional regulator [Phytomonospora sp. NPDC050363]|uniref:LysR family transcriptional regulator n=1 Tax=Phytomonospora sp. NPDC050363 TaxID=3155642 RepID=UPI0033ED18D6
MDLVKACRAFVHVSEQGGFTAGAAAVGMSQSVASRRVAALEDHLGEALFERSPRRARLTRFGRDVLPAARRLVRAVTDLEHAAATALDEPFLLAVPDNCSTGDLATLVANARDHGFRLAPQTGSPTTRTELARTQEVRAALIAVPSDEATWVVPLGLAAARDHSRTCLYLETLRPSRTDTSSPARIWIQPEDDVPHIRDPVRRLCDAAGLRPTQLAIGSSLVTATAEVFSSHDRLLCSRAQAEELGLRWRPIGDVGVERGFSVAADSDRDAEHIRIELAADVARALGASGEGRP